MAITSLNNAKLILKITDDSQDSLITALIPLVEADYLGIRGIPFDRNEDDNIVYPTGAELTAISMIGYRLNTISREGLSGESHPIYSVNYERGSIGGYPDPIIKGIARYAKFI